MARPLWIEFPGAECMIARPDPFLTRNESGLLFEEFIFKGNTYPQTWGSDILKKHRFHLLHLITEIGLNINKFVATA
jgi:hypothetical protein